MSNTKTLHLRVKDKHAKWLAEQAGQVNQVWNFCVGTAHKYGPKHYVGKTKFFSNYDYHKLTSGLSKEEGIILPAASIQSVCDEVATRTKRTATKKWQIPRFRASFGAKKALGWIPFKKSSISYKNGQLKFNGKFISVWDSHGLSKYALGTGNFSQDARGRWYLNTTVEVKEIKHTGTKSVGIDLGCKEAVVCSDGTRLEGRNFRKLEDKLATSQRAGHKNRIRAIHAKIANKRKDELHKLSSELVEQNAAIFVGNVSAKAMAKTNMAKSASDAGWGIFKTMLKYKSHWAGIEYMEVSEAYTTQTCSSCGVISVTSPKGRAGLGIREWTCSECGTVHDRDINAAQNILAAGHCRLAGGIH